MYDSVFGPDSTNEDVYQAIASPIVESALGGFNATVFAYGQTSSGKTHTMLGHEFDPGVTPRAIEHVLRVAKASKTRKYLIRASYVEIYNDKIRDLQNPDNSDLAVREDKAGRVFVEAEETVVETLRDAMQILEAGQAARHVGETNMNARSSRSHTVFSLLIESKSEDDLEKSFRASSLNLVDLAGSERLKSTGAKGQRAKEGAHINKSLLVLGTIINRLSSSGGDPRRLGHLPYRDSKLTRLLRPALGGNAKTAVLCAMTPSPLHIEETVSTLKFAERAKKVTNNATRNEVVDFRTKYKQAAMELGVLRERFAALEAENAQLRSQKDTGRISPTSSVTDTSPTGTPSLSAAATQRAMGDATSIAEAISLKVDIQAAKEEIGYLKDHVDEVETENEHLREQMKKKNIEFRSLRTRALELRQSARRARQKERATCRALILTYRKLEEAREQLEMSRKKGAHVRIAEGHLQELSTKLKSWLPADATDEAPESVGQTSSVTDGEAADENGTPNNQDAKGGESTGSTSGNRIGRNSSSGLSDMDAEDDEDGTGKTIDLPPLNHTGRRRRARPLPEDLVADIDDEETEREEEARYTERSRALQKRDSGDFPRSKLEFDDTNAPSMFGAGHRRISSVNENGVRDVALWREMGHRRAWSMADESKDMFVDGMRRSSATDSAQDGDEEQRAKPKGWKAFKSFYGYGYTRGSVYDALVGGHRVPSAAKHVSA